MASPGGGPEVFRFRVAALVGIGLVTLVAVLLLPGQPAGVRRAASSAGLLGAAVLAIASGFARASRTARAHRRPWLLLSGAGLLPLLGNTWVAISGADPVTSPSGVGESSVALGLLVSILGLLAFPTERRRGAQLATMVLDGLVAGAALLVIFSVLVYSEVQHPSPVRGLGGDFRLVVPILDVVLATVALLLIVRSSRSQRLTFTLVASGFLLYTVADLSFAVRVARGTFAFGSLLDLGWIAGYLVLGLAAWVPNAWLRRRDAQAAPGPSDALGTLVVFAVLLLAAVVQVAFGDAGSFAGAQAVLWVVLVIAVGARQVVLAADNTMLRRGLERRVTEQTADLSRYAHQTELLLESVGDGIYGVDRDGLITFVNPRAAQALGWTAAELDRRRPQDVFHAHESAGTAVERALTGRVTVTSTDEVYRRADGQTFPVESTVAPLLDAAEVTGAVVVFRDVTQRREVERMKDEFVGVVSHELRTPLTAIRASLELIESGHLGELTPRASRMVTVARESAERLSRLISDLLDLERLESGAVPIAPTVLDARALLLTAARQLGPLVTSMGLRLEVGAAQGEVLADEDQVLQALTNLVGNASKFSPPGSTVVLTAHRDGSHVRFDVTDHGRGIPADRLASIFERFVQVDSSDTREKGGTGLGLTITRGIVTRHGGEIRATSTVGVGTTVSFTLPTAGPPDVTSAPAPGGEVREGHSRTG